MNSVNLVGRLTRDPETSYTPNGVMVAKFAVAVNRPFKNDAGEYEADFFNCVAWRKTAEFVSQYLAKGRLVSIGGRLQTRKWQDQATGQTRTATDVIVNEIQPIGPRPNDSDDEAPQRPPLKTTPGQPTRPGQAANADDEDPFADEY